MALQIYTNTSVNPALRQLELNQQCTKLNLEKLSSGFRINRAADDAAGLAICQKFEASYRGTHKSIENLQYAMNYIQTAEGALEEMTNAIQRIRVLTVQAANDTNTQSDREKIQCEIKELVDFIDKTADQTTFNGIKPLRLSPERVKELTKKGGRADISFIIDTSGSMAGEIANVRDGLNGFVNILQNEGVDFQISVSAMSNQAPPPATDWGDTDDWTNTTLNFTNNTAAVWGQLNAYTGVVGALVDTYGSLLEVCVPGCETFAGTETGRNNIGFDNISAFKRGGTIRHFAIMLTDARPEGYAGNLTGYGAGVPGYAGNAREIACGNALAAAGVTTFVLANQGGGYYGYYNDITSITGGGIYDVEGSAAQIAASVAGIADLIASYSQDMGKLLVDTDAVKIEASQTEGDYLSLHRPHVTPEGLGLYSYNVATSTADNISNNLIPKADEALEKISQLRTYFGAKQNLIESKIRNLSMYEEQLKASQSQLQDVDVAVATSNLVKSQIVTQASIAMVSQASNIIPNAALTLLNG